MSILDPRYIFFVNRARSAALSFKVHSRVALVLSDSRASRTVLQCPRRIQGVPKEIRMDYRFHRCQQCVLPKR
ncbi:hypothetical protein V8F44DRAFT_613401 [Aspergillus fumigatus]